MHMTLRLIVMLVLVVTRLYLLLLSLPPSYWFWGIVIGTMVFGLAMAEILRFILEVTGFTLFALPTV